MKTLKLHFNASIFLSIGSYSHRSIINFLSALQIFILVINILHIIVKCAYYQRIIASLSISDDKKSCGSEICRPVLSCVKYVKADTVGLVRLCCLLCKRSTFSGDYIGTSS